MIPAGIYLFVALTVAGPAGIESQQIWYVPQISMERCVANRRALHPAPVARLDGTMREPGLFAACMNDFTGELS